MKENIENLLKCDDRETRMSLMFFLCFNLIEDECRYTSGELRKAVYDALDMMGEKLG